MMSEPFWWPMVEPPLPAIDWDERYRQGPDWEPWELQDEDDG